MRSAMMAEDNRASTEALKIRRRTGHLACWPRWDASCRAEGELAVDAALS